MNDADFQKGAHTLLLTCGQLLKTEMALILTDGATKEVGEILEAFAIKHDLKVKHILIDSLEIHGKEPDETIAKEMLDYDLILGLTSYSMAHTQARKAATDKGARYLSLPDYDLSVLASPALQADFEAQEKVAAKISSILEGASSAVVESALGTKLNLDLRTRPANNCVGILREKGSLSSPPDMEVNIAPIENGSHGKVCIDGSIPHPLFGVLEKPVYLIVENGAITSFESEDKKLVDDLNTLFDKFPANAKILAEFGIGLNPKAKLCGRMLEDEGCLGTIHFGFGSNATIGGMNSVSFHVDFIMRHATIIIDDQKIMEDGKLLI